MKIMRIKSFLDIRVNDLVRKGVRLVLIDLDGTLINVFEQEVSPEIEEWFIELESQGICFCIVSNNNRKRLERIFSDSPVSFYYLANKPVPRKTQKLISDFNLSIEEIVFVGDSFLTDCLISYFLNISIFLTDPVVSKNPILRLYDELRVSSRNFFKIGKKSFMDRPF